MAKKNGNGNGKVPKEPAGTFDHYHGPLGSDPQQTIKNPPPNK